jgi:hypothetical protein
MGKKDLPLLWGRLAAAEWRFEPGNLAMGPKHRGDRWKSKAREQTQASRLLCMNERTKSGQEMKTGWQNQEIGEWNVLHEDGPMQCTGELETWVLLLSFAHRNRGYQQQKQKLIVQEHHRWENLQGTRARGNRSRPRQKSLADATRTRPDLAGLLHGLDWKLKTQHRSKTPREKTNRWWKKNEENGSRAEKWLAQNKIQKGTIFALKSSRITTFLWRSSPSLPHLIMEMKI